MGELLADLAGKVAVVTGAASGMGRATAELLSEFGSRLALVDIDPAVAQVGATLGGAQVHVGDIVDSGFCDAAIDAVVEEFGRLDVLVNAAGTIHRASALGTTDADFARVMSVNVTGTFSMSRAAVGHMTTQGSGAIINFGSIWGGVGSPGATAYCASKGAVHQLTRAMALDHVEAGVRINAVAPGEVRTPMLSAQRPAPPTEDELRTLAETTIPMKRLAEPVEIARVVAFLASDAASYITGEIVHVDAGYTAR